MKTLKIGFKLVVVGLIAAITSYATRQVVAQRPAKSSRPTKVTTGPITAPKPSGDNGWMQGGARRIQPGFDATTLTSYSMPKLGIEAVGQNLVISAEAQIFDRRPNSGYLWAVRILDPTDNESAIFEKQYKDQVFSVDETNEIRPTFQDVIPVQLPPGTYTVEMIVYQVHSDYRGLDGLANPLVAKHARGPQGWQKVMIE